MINALISLNIHAINENVPVPVPAGFFFNDSVSGPVPAGTEISVPVHP